LTYCESMTGAILAGGKSSRFGGNKALFPVHGVPMIKRILKILRSYTDETFIVVSNLEAPFKHLNVALYKDIIPGKGPLSGLHSALFNAKYKKVFLLACDMPFVSEMLVGYMVSIASIKIHYPVIVPKGPGGLEPLHAIYDKELLSQVEERLSGSRLSIKAFVEETPHYVIDLQDLRKRLDPGLSIFNVNTKKDLENAIYLYDKSYQERNQNPCP